MNEIPATSPLSRFVALEKERRVAEARVKQIKAEQSLLQGTILEQWANEGIQNTRIDGLTVHIREDFYCNKKAGVSAVDVCGLLKDHGMDAMVAEGYSAAALKAQVKELDRFDQVPDDLRRVLNFDTVPRLVAVKSG